MVGSDIFETLSNFDSKNKDVKVLVSVLLGFLSDFQEKYETMFLEFKKEVIEEKDKEILEMKGEVLSLKRKIASLEERIEDSEFYERRDALIISGSKVPAAKDKEDCDQIVRNLTRQHLKLSIPENEISIAHTLKASSGSAKRSIIVKFCRRNMKTDVMNAARKLKVEGLFFNECLTPTQRTIGYVLRQAKREFPTIISGSTTFDGKHHVWTKPPNPNAPGARDSKHVISSFDGLRNFATGS